MLLHIGYQNYINSEKIITILDMDTAPALRIARTAKDKGKCIDCSKNRKSRTLLIIDSGHIVLSALTNEALNRRMEDL